LRFDAKSNYKSLPSRWQLLGILSVDCISPGFPIDEYSTYYIDPDVCIDCGACEIECPNGAIFELDLVPDNFQADSEKLLSAPKNAPEFNEEYTGQNHKGEEIQIPAVRTIAAGEEVDLTPSIEQNSLYFTDGPGYSILQVKKQGD